MLAQASSPNAMVQLLSQTNNVFIVKRGYGNSTEDVMDIVSSSSQQKELVC